VTRRDSASTARERRRRLLKWLPLSLLWPASTRSAERVAPLAQYPPVVPGYRLRFPHDEGSHPAFRTEWWYITGWLDGPGRAPIGFQVTFFRTRPETDARNPSAFAPRELIIAHAALSDAKRGKLVHDQKLARAAFGLAGASEGRTHVWIDDWKLAQDGPSYRVEVPARDFTIAFAFEAKQPPLLQGENGYSRKGPQPQSASYYYSIPHLRVHGELAAGGTRVAVAGSAWLDHEWSSSYMDERASGWDWIGINLADGGALMLFRMRERGGGNFWAGGSLRAASGATRTFVPSQVEMTPTRSWRSSRTGANYPVAWRVKAAGFTIDIQPLMDDQEHDTRVSVGTVYWEGAVTALIEGKIVGRGYLELTGYWQPMKL
jgi:predicted secreted hydrolase